MTITAKFRKVYADAVISTDLPDKEWNDAQTAARVVRKLKWKGDFIPLADAAKLYSMIEGGYNEFTPDMFANLDKAFPNAGIEVAPAREGSVAAYLKIPVASRAEVESYIEEHWNPDESEWNGETLRVWWD